MSVTGNIKSKIIYVRLNEEKFSIFVGYKRIPSEVQGFKRRTTTSLGEFFCTLTGAH